MDGRTGMSVVVVSVECYNFPQWLRNKQLAGDDEWCRIRLGVEEYYFFLACYTSLCLSRHVVLKWDL